MTHLLNILSSLLPAIESQRDRDEAYLGGAVDLHDLERRLREIDERGRRTRSPIEFGLYVR